MEKAPFDLEGVVAHLELEARQRFSKIEAMSSKSPTLYVQVLEETAGNSDYPSEQRKEIFKKMVERYVAAVQARAQDIEDQFEANWS